MSDDKKEPWLNLLALTTVIFAVCATLSTFKAGGFSTKSVISQAQASDQWSYFQAKNLRGNLYKLQVEKLQLDSSVLPRATEPEIRERYAKAIRDAESSVRKYESEKAEIQKAAKTLEAKRDDAQRRVEPRTRRGEPVYLTHRRLLKNPYGLYGYLVEGTWSFG